MPSSYFSPKIFEICFVNKAIQNRILNWFAHCSLLVSAQSQTRGIFEPTHGPFHFHSVDTCTGPFYQRGLRRFTFFCRRNCIYIRLLFLDNARFVPSLRLFHPKTKNSDQATYIGLSASSDSRFITTLPSSSI